MLARCMDATEPPAQTYAEIGRSAFGRPGELFVGLIVAVDLLIVCVTYLILCVDEIGVLWQEFKGRWVYLGVGVAGVPLAILRNMRVLSYVGVFGGFPCDHRNDE